MGTRIKNPKYEILKLTKTKNCQYKFDPFSHLSIRIKMFILVSFHSCRDHVCLKSYNSAFSHLHLYLVNCFTKQKHKSPMEEAKTASPAEESLLSLQPRWRSFTCITKVNHYLLMWMMTKSVIT